MNDQADARRRPRAPRSAAVRTKSGMTAGQACEPGLTDSTPTNAHSGRWSSHSSGRADDRDRGREPGEQPGPARRAVPQLGHEVGEGQDHERQRRVVVVLEGGPVDARPRDPLGREPDRDEGQREAPALERHPRPRRPGRDAQPPDDEAAGVVERRRRPAGEALLVEPDGLEVRSARPTTATTPGAPRSGRCGSRTSGRSGRAGSGRCGPAGQPRDQLVVLDQRPRDVRDDVDAERQDDQADGHPDDRQPEQPARPEPAVGRRAGRVEQPDRVVRRPAARRAARTRAVRRARTGRRRRATPRPRAIATSSGVTASDPSAIGRVEPAGRQRPEEDERRRAPPARRPRTASPRRSRRSGGRRRRPRPAGSARP